MRTILAIIAVALIPAACSPGNGSAGVERNKVVAAGVTSTDSEHPMDHAVKQTLSQSKYDVTPLPPERVKEMASKLDPEAYRITQKEGTERAFCGTLLDNKKDGTYVCIVCGLPLFSSEHKFDSRTGWPSFYREFDPEHVVRHEDRAYGMVRTEIECARCGAHLGHVFDDGPRPTGERHCLNSASLRFFEAGQELPAESRPAAGE